MKKFLTILLTSGVLFSGCGNDKISEDKNTFTYGTVAYGVAMENAGTNPHESYCGWSTLRYGIGETLFKFNENMELEPFLAESFQQIDDFTIKIKIRDKITFSNGKKVDGEAVKKCLENLIKNHDRAPKDLKIISITAENNFVTIKSSEKVPALLNYLSDPYGCIIDVDEGEKNRIVIGTGPYKAVKVSDTEIELEKNLNYWGSGKPKLDKIFVKSISDGDTLTMAMQNGELDAVQGLPYSSLKLFDDKNFKISQTNTSRVYQFAFNFKTQELQDKNVRKAICMAIDKNNFTKILLENNGTPAISPFPANLSFGDKNFTPIDFNIEESKKILENSGWKDTNGDGFVDKNGKNLELNYLTYTSRQELPILAEFVQESLKKIGIKLNINATDNYKNFLKNGEYDIFSKAIVTAPTGDPEYYFTSHILPGAVDNAGFYDSKKISELENELHNTFGAKKRSEIAIKMSQEILDDYAVFYVSHLKMSFVMKKNIAGFNAHPSDYYEITSALEKK